MTTSVQPLRVALLGCGVVGSSVATMLVTQAQDLHERVGRPLELVGIAVRRLDRDRATVPVDPSLFTTDAAELVTRADIVAVPVDVTLPDLVEVFREHGYSRVPVFRGNLDQPLGLIHLKDLAMKHGFGARTPIRFAVRPMLRPLLYVPGSMPISASRTADVAKASATVGSAPSSTRSIAVWLRPWNTKLPKPPPPRQSAKPRPRVRR